MIVSTAVHEAERSVLGSMLRDNGVIGDVLQVLNAEHFRTDCHRKVFAAISGLYDDEKPVDSVTLADALHKCGQISDVGYGYIGELWDAAPTAANVSHYTGIVHEDALRRGLQQIGEEIATDARNSVDAPARLLDSAEQRILSLADTGLVGQTIPLADAVNEAFDRLDARRIKGERAEGLATGFIDLDARTAGLHDGEVMVIAARPSIGKTALATSLARNALRAGCPVLFVSLEQTAAELAERLICSEAEINGHKVRAGTLSDAEASRFHEAGAALRRDLLFIADSPCQNMLRIAANARRHKLRHGIKLVILDYLQLVEPENPRDPRHEQVAGVSRRLKRLARELKVPVVALAQLNREVEHRPDAEPRLSDLRESGSIEADADTVLLMHRPKVAGIIEINVAKQRNGPTGKLRLVFRSDCQRFENYAPSASSWDSR